MSKKENMIISNGKITASKHTKTYKTKIVMVKTMELALILKDIMPSKHINEIPASTLTYSKKEKDISIIDYNIYKNDTTIKVNDIEYVKMNAKKEFVDNFIKLENYSYKGKGIKVLKPNMNIYAYEVVGLLIPVEIFKVVLNEYADIDDDSKLYNTKLCNLLVMCNSIFDIKLLDKNKKEIGYALMYAE